MNDGLMSNGKPYPGYVTAFPNCKYDMSVCGCADRGYKSCVGIGYYGGEDDEDDPYLEMAGRAAEARESRKNGCLFALMIIPFLFVILGFLAAAGSR